MAKQKGTDKMIGGSATSYGQQLYGSPEQQHAAGGTGNMIAMNTIRGGKRKSSKTIFGKLKNMTGRMRKYTMGLIRKTPKYSKSRKARRTSRRR